MKKSAAKPSFEASLQQLEATVEDLETGDLGLDQAMARYETGVKLLAQCHGLLDAADRKVALLLGVTDDGQPESAPFDASATIDRPPIASPPKMILTDGRDDLPF